MKQLFGFALALFLSACAAKNSLPEGAENQAEKTAILEQTAASKNTQVAKEAPTEAPEKEQVQAQDEQGASAATKANATTSAKTGPQVKILASVEAEKNSPLAVVQSYTETLRGVVETENEMTQQRDEKIASQVREFFDFQELARRSLGKHWDSTSAKNRKQYADLFIQLVEKSYLKRSRNLIGNYQVNFKDQSRQSNYAKVLSTVTRKDADIDISYELGKNDGKWMIYNIILDDVNLIRNYQTQFNQIIGKKGFGHLISLMEKRLNTEDTLDVNI